METDQSLGFNDTQFQANFMAADFTNEIVYENFFQTITENVSHFARQNKNAVYNLFSQFPLEVRTSLRQHLADAFLQFNELDKVWKLKAKKKLN